MSDRQPIQSVPDYTGAFLVSFFVLIFLVLFAIWTIAGLVFAGIAGWLGSRAITLGQRMAAASRERRAAQGRGPGIFW